MTQINHHLFKGALSINNVVHQPAAENSPNLGKLFSGLRINGQKPTTNELSGREAELLKASDFTNSTQPNDAVPESSTEPASPTAKFFSELSKRLTLGNGKAEPALLLANSLVDTVGQVKSKFGQDKANEFMSAILTATDAGVNEDTLSSAMGNFFNDIWSSSQFSQETSSKLNDLRTILNQGLISENMYEKKPGLSSALNSYFGSGGGSLAGGQDLKVKGFNANFERTYITVAEIMASTSTSDNNDYYMLGEGHFEKTNLAGSEAAIKVADYLRNEIGNEEAASYLESSADSNFMVGLATACAIVVNENGQDAANQFISFLNGNINKYLSASQEDVIVENILLGLNYADPEQRQSSLLNGSLTAPETGQSIAGMSDNDLFSVDRNSFNVADFVAENDFFFQKQHQGLYIHLAAQNGSSAVGHGFDLDLTALYQNYMSSPKTADQVPLNAPKGNLVDKTI